MTAPTLMKCRTMHVNRRIALLCSPEIPERAVNKGLSEMILTAKIPHLLFGALLLASCGAAPPRQASLTTWTDPDTGCIYHIVDEGLGYSRVYSMTVRYRRDGTPDCPDAQPAT